MVDRSLYIPSPETVDMFYEEIRKVSIPILDKLCINQPRIEQQKAMKAFSLAKKKLYEELWREYVLSDY